MIILWIQLITIKSIQKQNSSTSKEESEEMEEDYENLQDCGYMACKPEWAQPLASIKVFVLLLSMLVTLQQALNRLREEIRLLAEQDQAPPSNEELARALSSPRDTTQDRSGGDGAILGVEGLDYRLGGCCSPLPGEPIVGTVALGNHGITIHRQCNVRVLECFTYKACKVFLVSFKSREASLFPLLRT